MATIERVRCVSWDIVDDVPVLYILLLTSLAGATDRLQAAMNDSMNRRQGAIVALDVESGAILASYRMDVAARRTAAPGSAVKPFTLMALLDAGLVTEQTALFCPRTVRVNGRILDCSHQRLPGPLDAVAALAYSCNHFFATLAAQLPLNALPREFARAGLNSLTGRWRTELPGVVQQPGSKASVEVMAIGEENVQVTPLALAEAYRRLVRPLRDRSANPELQLVAKGLRAAVQTGTAQGAASRRVATAGKTGTAGGHGWFAGFAPADHPEILVVVFLERGAGGPDAAPIAGRLFDSYFAAAEAR